MSPAASGGEMDSLHILPLSVLPLRNPNLAKHKLIKNSHLEGVLEVYSNRETGSGQVAISHLPEHFSVQNPLADPDMRMLRDLAYLPSYDVYSLRRNLRALGIAVNDHNALKLSEDMNRALAGYMARFTMPLLRAIYGEAGQEFTRFEDLVALFRDPDVKKALIKLKIMADRLGVALDQIPRFIEDYGDIFLSLSYYQHCLDRIEPLLEEFQGSVEEMKTSYQMRSKPQVVAEANRMQKMFACLLQFVKRMFEDFEARSQALWRNISAEKFRHVKDVIENAHGTVGGVLCGLTVKMNAWTNKFPHPKAGGPNARESFLLSDIRPGMADLVVLARGQGSVAGFT
jgi:hypothetical protein